ncbi:hypothetical protein QZQ06_19775 [Serratia marcescens]|uniref:hypothetical protein n=1 Tax=Serratia marcescens TaxID=615 RepID=UPI0018D6A231|nr:hypothetical protein [Serratia marcescens]MBH3230504.1 hypothetical protein [Serratia marcescens]MDP8651950.1 hypothetical protein [Serratia marcescens]MDP8666802.1 hypothetical protein [Serratia marcescens]MDP8740904.1 hypothetical protein [Serratia marcescens]MDP8815419.1 hypothetical protein [Serratia marcescens]
MTLTTEQLKARITHYRELAYRYGMSGNQKHEAQYRDDAAFLEELLANREAQPVALVDRRPAASGGICWQHGGKDLPHGTELFTAPPAPANAQAVAWEMRYWNSGHNCWHDWERITAEQHAEMSVKFATDNDYEFRVLYDAPPAPVVPEEISTRQAIVKMDSHEPCDSINVAYKLGWNACRAAMLAAAPEGGNDHDTRR